MLLHVHLGFSTRGDSEVEKLRMLRSALYGVLLGPNRQYRLLDPALAIFFLVFLKAVVNESPDGLESVQSLDLCLLNTTVTC